MRVTLKMPFLQIKKSIANFSAKILENEDPLLRVDNICQLKITLHT